MGYTTRTGPDARQPAGREPRAERPGEEHFRTVFREAAVGMVILDLAGRVLELNPALERMLGYGGEDLLNRPVESLLYAQDDVCGEREHFGQLLTGRRDAFQAEKRLLARDGGVVTAQVTVSLLHDADGRNAYALGLVEDVTTRQVAEAMGQHSARLQALQELSVGVKHEINNVLATLQGNAELLSGSPNLAPEERTSVAAIQLSVQRLADAVCRLDRVEELPLVRYVGREWMVDLSARAAPARRRRP
jgi:PAS domain S-box-containing protein